PVQVESPSAHLRARVAHCGRPSPTAGALRVSMYCAMQPLLAIDLLLLFSHPKQHFDVASARGHDEAHLWPERLRQERLREAGRPDCAARPHGKLRACRCVSIELACADAPSLHLL